MPEISRFLGIIIAMYFNDHEPPHFRVRYGGFRSIIAIESLDVIAGRLHQRAYALVVEWTVKNRRELRYNWARARRHEELLPIPPLE